MRDRAAKIKLLILDVDGVLTDGLLYFNEAGDAMKAFYVRDGMGIRLLLEHGVEVGLITARNSKIVESRAKDLAIPHVYQGRKDKFKALQELLTHLKLDLSEVAYMGDDIIDLPVLARVGLSAAPKDAHGRVKEMVAFVSAYKAGKGAVRELCELILDAQDKLEPLIARALENGQIFEKVKSTC